MIIIAFTILAIMVNNIVLNGAVEINKQYEFRTTGFRRSMLRLKLKIVVHAHFSNPNCTWKYVMVRY